MDSSGNQEKGDENLLNVSQESQESDVSKSEETSSSDVNTSSSKSESQSDSSKSDPNSSRSDVNSSLDKSLNVSKDAIDEEEMVKNIFTVNSSMEKSSPFHGFSSQDDVAAGEDVSDEANKELKQQMFADFGIDNDDSEEETENSDCETEIVKKLQLVG